MVVLALRKRSERLWAMARLLLVSQSLMALAELRVQEEGKGWGWRRRRREEVAGV